MSTETTPPATGQGNNMSPTGNANPASQSYDWKQHIPTEFKEAPFWGGVKDVSDLVTQFANGQRLIGADKVVLPQKDWKDAEWNAFYDKLGRPAVDKYAFPVDDKGLSILDKEATDSIAKMAHAAGMTQRQLDAFVKWQGEQVSAMETEEQGQMEARIGEYRTALQKEFGAELPAVVDSANRALAAFGDTEFTQLITSDPAIANSPAVIRMLHRLGNLMGEDTARATGVQQGAYASPAMALNAIKQFEQENAAIIFNTNPNALPFAEQTRRNRLLAERAHLYRIAYPTN